MSSWLALVAVALLIAANAMFVAAEFALVSVRRGDVGARAEAGDRRAKAVLRELDRMSFMLSAAQFGITATSLLVGFLAEGAIGDTLVRPVVDRLGLPESTALGVSVTAAFVISTALQMVVGELGPKNLAIAEPLKTSLRTAPFMALFSTVFGPLIRFFDRTAEGITRRLGIEVTSDGHGGLGRDELARIVSASGEGGALSEAQTDLMLRAVDFAERRAGEIMVARPDVTWMADTQTLDEVRAVSRQSGFSRFPVRGANEDEVVGTVHLKDLLKFPREDWPTTTVDQVAQPPLAVPESEPIERLLTQMRATRRTFAIVVDEYGGTAGIVTLENVLEELVGDIRDEFDREVGRLRRVGAGTFTVQGALRAGRVEEAFGVDLGEGDFETVAGFVLEHLGHIPAVGEHVDHDGWRFEVTKVEGVRIVELRLRRLPEPVESEEAP